MSDSRYIIGIDLGTTNIAVCYIDGEQDDGEIVAFPIPQLTAAGEVDTQPLLPSFCYLPGTGELPAGSLALPWDARATLAVGRFARDHGAQAPARLIASTKSWLSHAGVDRTKPILPWGSNVVAQPLSPVQVTTAFLSHIRAAWNHQFKGVKGKRRASLLLENQQVVITIPASFDETARELTIAAATAAGYENICLLEEPLAAFYAWLQGRESDWYRTIDYDQNCLIIDIGGGTTDFSVVRIDDEGYLHRFAVGSHLLLGGDNIDMALARGLESQWQTKLGAADWTLLCQRCREAKEVLLESRKVKADITLLGAGSSVLKNIRRAELRRDDLVELLEQGFYPTVPLDAPPPRQRTGMRTMGLPYAAEPSVTHYLLAFLRQAARVIDDADGQDCLYPDRVLFNGGSMKTAMIRRRILDVIAAWHPNRERPKELVGADVSQAVAVGAAYYGRVLRGHGVRVRSGLAHTCYLEVADAEGGAHLVTVMPRDTDENVVVAVPGDFNVQTNQKVRFNLYTSDSRLGDQAGDVLRADGDEPKLIAPLISVIKDSSRQEENVGVRIAALMNEVGRLEISLEATDGSQSWPLNFDLRAPPASPPAATTAPESADDPPETAVEPERIAAAQALLHDVFDSAADNLKPLTRRLEEVLAVAKPDWSLPVLRALADAFLELSGCRSRSPFHESRWLNLTGYCLRPGFGDPGDELRLQQVWQLWVTGAVHQRDWDVAAEWYVFWRRLACGLGVGHQITIGQGLAERLFPEGRCLPGVPWGERARQEMWRCLAALELQPVPMKIAAGQVLVEQPTVLRGFECWVLARLGARHLFHAPANAVVPAEIAEQWLAKLMSADRETTRGRMHLFAISRIAALTGDRSLDLAPECQAEVCQYMAEQDSPARWTEILYNAMPVSAADQARVLGDALPLGLVLVSGQ